MAARPRTSNCRPPSSSTSQPAWPGAAQAATAAATRRCSGPGCCSCGAPGARVSSASSSRAPPGCRWNWNTAARGGRQTCVWGGAQQACQVPALGQSCGAGDDAPCLPQHASRQPPGLAEAQARSRAAPAGSPRLQPPCWQAYRRPAPCGAVKARRRESGSTAVATCARTTASWSLRSFSAWPSSCGAAQAGGGVGRRVGDWLQQLPQRAAPWSFCSGADALHPGSPAPAPPPHRRAALRGLQQRRQLAHGADAREPRGQRQRHAARLAGGGQVGQAAGRLLAWRERAGCGGRQQEALEVQGQGSRLAAPRRATWQLQRAAASGRAPQAAAANPTQRQRPSTASPAPPAHPLRSPGPLASP